MDKHKRLLTTHGIANLQERHGLDVLRVLRSQSRRVNVLQREKIKERG